MSERLTWAYFGGEPIGVPVLETLKKHNLLPDLIVCNPDRKSGRKLVLTPPPIKNFAVKNDIPVFQPESLKDKNSLAALTAKDWDLFVVVAYNHMIPKWLYELPTLKTINLHPSLLPKLRGPSPIRSAILNNDKQAIGVSVILLNEKLDSGDILAKEPVIIDEEDWPISGHTLDKKLANAGSELLVKIIPRLQSGEVVPIKQNEEEASYTKKFTKEMGHLKLDPFNLPNGKHAKDMLSKIRAYEGFPGTFFMQNGRRVKLVSAEIKNHTLKPLQVIPEGKKVTSFDNYLETLRP